MVKGKQIGVDLGGTTAKIGVVNENNEIVERIILPMDHKPPFEEAIKAIAEAILQLGDIASVGFGVPSTLIPGSDIIIHANNLGWKNADIRGELQKYLKDIPVYIANDADCAAVGEMMHGAAMGVGNTLMLTLGTGVGGSFIYQNKLFLGGNGFGFEPGHISIERNGISCTCGNRGCLECYASATALARAAVECKESPLLARLIDENHGKANAKMVFGAAAAGDHAANRILDDYINALAVGVANLITLFGPDLVVIGGGVSGAGERLFAPLRELAYGMVDGIDVMGRPPIVPAQLGNDAGIIGAAMLGYALN